MSSHGNWTMLILQRNWNIGFSGIFRGRCDVWPSSVFRSSGIYIFFVWFICFIMTTDGGFALSGHYMIYGSKISS